ncbi:MAG: HEPN domain-containing protein [Thermodesulfobacteriota bacterium]
MIDIIKQIAYWRKSAEEDWDIAVDLLQREKTRYGLFFSHLALEKALKAHVCRAKQDMAPRSHALLRLAELSQLSLTSDQRLFLSEFDRYQIEGRYPEDLLAKPSPEEARAQLRKAEETFQWLMRQL